MELENRENQTFSRMSKQRASCLGGFKGSHGMWSINDLPEKTERSPPFQREDISFVLMSLHMAWIIKTLHHAGKIHERSCELFQLWFAAHQSKLSEKRKGIRGREESWKPLVFLQSVNRPLDSGIRRVNQALEVVLAPGQDRNEKCLNEEGH